MRSVFVVLVVLVSAFTHPVFAQHARLQVVTRVNYHGAVSPDGERLAYYSIRGIRVASTDRRGGNVIAEPDPGCANLVWSPNSQRLAWVSADGIDIWNRAGGSIERIRNFHRGFFGDGFRCTIAFDENNRLLYVSPTEQSELAYAQSVRNPLVMAVFREGAPSIARVERVNFAFGPPETSPQLAARRVPYVYEWNGRSTGGTFRTHDEPWFARTDLATGERVELARGEGWGTPENPVGPDGRACIRHDATVACFEPGRREPVHIALPPNVESLRIESRPHRSPFSPSGRLLLLHANTAGGRTLLAVHDFETKTTELHGERAFIDRDWQTDELLMLSQPMQRAQTPGLVRLNVRTRARRALAAPGVELVRPIFVPNRTDLFYFGRERDGTRDLVRAAISPPR